MTRSHFAPGDVGIAIGIEPDGEIDIAQRDIPLAGDFLAFYIQDEIAVAGLVRMRRG